MFFTLHKIVILIAESVVIDAVVIVSITHKIGIINAPVI